MKKPLFPRRLPPSAAGFTFFELLVMMAIILVIAAVAMANFGVTLKRAKLQGDATVISNAIQRARAVAIRRSKTMVVEIEPTSLELFFFFDEEDDPTEPGYLVYDVGVDEIAMPSIFLTEGRTPASSVRFWSPIDDASPDAENAMADFTSRSGLWPALVIDSDGSIRDLGGIRIGMGSDPTSAPYTDGNFMEVRVVTAATGRTEIRKLVPFKDPPYEPRQQTPNGPNWKFY